MERDDMVKAIVQEIRDVLLPQSLPADQLGVASAYACILRSAALVDRCALLSESDNPEGVGLLIRGAFESCTLGLWLLSEPQNVIRLYADYQRSSRALLLRAGRAGELSEDLVRAAVAAVDSNLPDDRLPSFEQVVMEVHEWAAGSEVAELGQFDDMYRRLYRPLSLFDVHGFGPVHRYMLIPGVDQPISLLATPDPFMLPDELTFVFAGLLASIGVVVLGKTSLPTVVHGHVKVLAGGQEKSSRGE